MKKGKRLKSIAKSIGTGIFTVFLFLLLYFALNKNTAPFLLILREVFPLYDEGPAGVFNLYAYAGNITEDGGFYEKAVEEVIPGDIDGEEASEGVSYPVTELVSTANVIMQEENDKTMRDNSQLELITVRDREKLKDFAYLKSSLYTVDKRTDLLESDIDIDEFLSMDFRLNKETAGPKILIFHTHSQEAYANSEKGNLEDGIFLVGAKLAELLENKYGIQVMHDKSSYDIVDGSSAILGAYERMELKVAKILEENPGIEMVIDLHRDGVGDNNLKFVTEIEGKPTAKIMFFNGLCRIYKGGELIPAESLHNPYLKENLALSLNLQLLANEYFPDFTRRLYINAYRYSLHFKPKSLLVEVGAQTNTKEEALNAMEPLAEIIAKTVN